MIDRQRAVRSPSLPSRLRTAAAGFALVSLGGSVAAASLAEFVVEMTQDDRQRANEAVQRALETRPSRDTVIWRSPDGGAAGVVTPVRTYRTTGGYYCRVYEERLQAQGAGERRRTATACRDDDGTWRNIATP